MFPIYILYVKKKGLSDEPYVKKYELSDDDSFMVIATEGLYDVYTDEDILKAVQTMSV